MKQALYKVVGKATLTWEELADILQDVELTLNNRPLGYVDDDVQMLILTQNTMLFGQPNSVPDNNIEEINDRDLRKRARYLNECKRKIWSLGVTNTYVDSERGITYSTMAEQTI